MDTIVATLIHAIGLSAEVLMLIISLMIAFIYSLSVGRGKMIALVLALLVSGSVYSLLQTLPTLFPFVAEDGSLITQLGTLTILVLVLTTILRRVIHGEYSHLKIKKAVQSLLLAVAFTGTLFALLHAFTSFSNVYAPKLTAALFSSSAAVLIWFAVSVLAIFFASKR